MEFINPWMLFGLAGISLPVIAHLLNRRKFTVVPWGAMQFLQLGKRSRRRMRLEELLLLAMRILMVALIALAVSRPWVSGGVLSQVVSGQTRDVVLIIDGSYSMQRKSGEVSMHDAAKSAAIQFLGELRSGDTAAVLDVRDHVRPVIVPPSRDLQAVRDAINDLPAPAGSANFPEALTRAVQLMQTSSNVAREIIVFTDGQKHGWLADEQLVWRRLGDSVQLSAVTPRLWVMDVNSDDPIPIQNFSLDQIDVQREQTVAGFPVRIQTTVSASGTSEPTVRNVKLQVDGEFVAGKQRSVRIEPDGQAPVEFEHKLQGIGPHVVSVVLDNDVLEADNRSEVSIHIGPGIPALLIDGDPQVDSAKSESFFLQIAYGDADRGQAWVAADVIPWTQIDPQTLPQYEVVILANVPRLRDAELTALLDFVASGKGLLVVAGDRVDADWYNTKFYGDGLSLLPAQLIDRQKAAGDILTAGMRLSASGLTAEWMERFRKDDDTELLRARFAQWWTVVPAANRTQSRSRPNDGEVLLPGNPIVAARFENNSPFLVSRTFGRGRVGLLTAPLDADWSTLPARRAFVPFVHELVFDLAAVKSRLNVHVGEPLAVAVEPDFDFAAMGFLDPLENWHDVEQAGDADHPVAQFVNTLLPGRYRLQSRSEAAVTREVFIVREDRAESDLTGLTEDERIELAERADLGFVPDIAELKSQMFDGESQSELWHILLWLFLLLLLGETLMTRRMVRGSHERSEHDDIEDYRPAVDEVPPVAAAVPLEEAVKERRRTGWSRDGEP